MKAEAYNKCIENRIKRWNVFYQSGSNDDGMVK